MENLTKSQITALRCHDPNNENLAITIHGTSVRISSTKALKSYEKKAAESDYANMYLDKANVPRQDDLGNDLTLAERVTYLHENNSL